MRNSFLFLIALILYGNFVFTGCEEENSKPTCSIENPSSGAEIGKGETVTISVKAEDEDGNIEEVRFYVDGSGIGSVDSFPYDYEWETDDVSPGDHTLKAEAFDGEGASEVDTIQITVVELNSGTFVDQRDEQEYEWIRIGDQIWMAENLNYSQHGVGNSWCYHNNSSNCETYGRLYDWAAVMQGESSSNSNPSEVQGVCPDGWHVPSDEEWKELEMQLGMSQSEADDDGWRGTNEGSKLAGNASLWNEGDLTNNSEFGASGFTALPGGHRYYNGGFDRMGRNGHWWSSTEYSSTNAWARYLDYYYGGGGVGRDNYDKDFGFSVRCVKD